MPFKVWRRPLVNWKCGIPFAGRLVSTVENKRVEQEPNNLQTSPTFRRLAFFEHNNKLLEPLVTSVYNMHRYPDYYLIHQASASPLYISIYKHLYAFNCWTPNHCCNECFYCLLNCRASRGGDRVIRGSRGDFQIREDFREDFVGSKDHLKLATRHVDTIPIQIRFKSVPMLGNRQTEVALN